MKGFARAISSVQRQQQRSERAKGEQLRGGPRARAPTPRESACTRISPPAHHHPIYNNNTIRQDVSATRGPESPDSMTVHFNAPPPARARVRPYNTYI